MNTGTANTMLWTPRRVPVPGLGDLFCEACGPADGPPVLLVMGAMNPAHFWAPGFVAALVQAGCRVLRYDHCDTGRSFVHSLHAPPYALDALVADALRVLEAWGLARAAVVGWSMGGYIAQHLAHEHKAGGLITLTSAAGKSFYAASILGVLSLGISHGETVTLSADGDGADAALDTLVEVLSMDLDKQ